MRFCELRSMSDPAGTHGNYPSSHLGRVSWLSSRDKQKWSFGGSARVQQLLNPHTASIEGTSVELRERIEELLFAEENQHLDIATKYTETYINSWISQYSNQCRLTTTKRLNAWSGWLQKLNRFASWQPRWFQLRWPENSSCDKQQNFQQHAILAYQSDSKGEQLLFVDKVRRDRWLDSGEGVAFSVRLTFPLKSDRKEQRDNLRIFSRIIRSRRLHLMAASDLEAATFLVCLRRILQPESSTPTPMDAAQQPGRVLRLFE